MKRIVKLTIYKEDGSYDSALTLNTARLDNIGWTDESLDEYMKMYILTNKKYYIKSSDRKYRK